MNIYGVVIVAALFFNFLIDCTSEILNLKALQPQLPEEFSDVYDVEAYRKSQNYSRVQTKFGFATTIFDLVILMVFWLSGGFNYLDIQVRSFGYGPVGTGLFYIAVLMLARATLSLPFSVYSTFVIEERFGFNRTTPLLFLADLGKGVLLSLLLGAPLLTAILYLFEWAGPNAWLYGWALVTFFTLFVQFIAPTWIMPLFNKFTPLADGDLKERIMSYAKSVSFSLENVFVMDGSKRSSKSNAFFTGFGKHKRIALFDTLIERHSAPELVAILAHEIGHYQKRHILQGMVLSIVHMGAMLYLLSIFIGNQGLFAAFYMDNLSVYGSLIFFGMLLTPLEMLISVLLNIWSRSNEFEADRFASQTADGGDLVTALKKLSVHNLANLTPHWFYVFLNYSHPPLLERIRAVRSGEA